jgi:hypothetical protein
VKENMQTIKGDDRQHNLWKSADYGPIRPTEFAASKEAEPKRRAIRLIDKARSRARKRGIEFCLTKEWVLDGLIRGTCAVTGIPFDLKNGRGSGKHNRYAPTIDRTDPSKGYRADNCQLVIYQYNVAKGRWEHDDVMNMARALVVRESSSQSSVQWIRRSRRESSIWRGAVDSEAEKLADPIFSVRNDPSRVD